MTLTSGKFLILHYADLVNKAEQHGLARNITKKWAGKPQTGLGLERLIFIMKHREFFLWFPADTKWGQG